MPLTVVVTRDVENRYRGFLASLMLEVSAGVYVAPDMRAGVRTRLWSVLDEWWGTLRHGSVVMIWRDASAAGKLRIETLGAPPREIVDADGVLLARRRLEGGTNQAPAL
ncbi:MAG: type I-E CRISPR-associated endoribonuclease Cas2 [Gemmatimonadetes bacterium]|nr:type I-E CRISPR-associated endoribonuclease Cas2 [Gemmatimonadota bacterium]